MFLQLGRVNSIKFQIARLAIAIIILAGSLGLFVFFRNIPESKAGIFTSSVVVTVAICGNNIMETGETCDDGNTVSYDGCGSSCQTETPVCGNGILESWAGEECDDGNGNANDGCGVLCKLEPSGTPNAPLALPGPIIQFASVIFQGRAYPGAQITFLKDGFMAGKAKADNDGMFRSTLSDLSGGVYTFGVFARDARGISSSMLNFTVYVTAGATTNISNIFIPPTLSLDKTQANKGDVLWISGTGFPLSNIDIHIQNGAEKIYKVLSPNDGVYSFNFNTNALEDGEYFAKSRARHLADGTQSAFSRIISFIIGKKIKPKFLKGDLNSDGRVDLIDFSIAAYWYKKPLSAAFVQKESERLNGDGKVDFVDFSVLAYWWTG